MNTDEIIAEVEKRLGTLDERAREAIELALQLAEEKLQLRWQGENPTWDEWQRMSEEERMKVMDELVQRNYRWLEKVRATLGAEWMLVIDGKVVRYGFSWDDYPTDRELEAACQEMGKAPLLFASNPIVEESSVWHPTICSSVVVNPKRMALAGRSLCLSLKPKVALDFEQKTIVLRW